VSDVVTGEAVALDLRVAQLPSRIVAAVIDFLVMAVMLYVLFFVGGQLLATGGADDALAAALVIVLTVGVFLGYPVIAETITRGRTLGKMAIGLRVVRDDGGPITFRHSFVRGLVGLVLERPGLLLLGLGPALGMIVSMLSANGKRIGDMAAGTIVLQERVSARPSWAPWMPAPLVGWAATLDLTGLDDMLALAVRQFLGRAYQFYPVAREELGRQLADEVRERTTPPPPPGTPGWAYLSAVLAERRHREEVRAAAAAGYPAPPIPIWPPPWPAPAWQPAPPMYAGGPAGGPGTHPYAGGPGAYPYAGGPAGGPGTHPYAGGPGAYPYAGGPAGGPATYPYAGGPGAYPYAGGQAGGPGARSHAGGPSLGAPPPYQPGSPAVPPSGAPHPVPYVPARPPDSFPGQGGAPAAPPAAVPQPPTPGTPPAADQPATDQPPTPGQPATGQPPAPATGHPPAQATGHPPAPATGQPPAAPASDPTAPPGRRADETGPDRFAPPV